MDGSDGQLLRSTAAGETDAFADLMARHMARIYRFAVAVLGDHTEAEDVAQETFIEAYKCAERFDGRVDAEAWLLGIASNRCRTWGRRRRRPELSLEDLAGRSGAPRGDAQADSRVHANPHDARMDIQRAVRALPPKYRLPIVLRFQEGLSCAEIADALGIATSTAAVRLYRARALLRERLSHLNDAEGRE